MGIPGRPVSRNFLYVPCSPHPLQLPGFRVGLSGWSLVGVSVSKAIFPDPHTWGALLVTAGWSALRTAYMQYGGCFHQLCHIAQTLLWFSKHYPPIPPVGCLLLLPHALARLANRGLANTHPCCHRQLSFPNSSALNKSGYPLPVWALYFGIALCSGIPGWGWGRRLGQELRTLYLFQPRSQGFDVG